MKEATLIFSHQLFEDAEILVKDRTIFLVEHPRFFTDFSFHKQKLLFHRASMQAYCDWLKKKNYTVEYIDLKKASWLFSYLHKKKFKKLYYYDTVDSVLEGLISTQSKKYKIELERNETPQFLTDLAYIEKKYGKKKSFHQTSFYIEQRKRLEILITKGKPKGGQWTYDKKNRESLPEDIKLPSLYKTRTNTYVKNARSWVKKHFSKNPGSTKTFIYPTTHKEAKNWLSSFLKNRFSQFGPYQDAIARDHPFLFHSILSPLLNSGLLTPRYVIEQALAYAKKNKVPINSLEGFIRQIIGWREFVRAIYVLKGKKERESNFFGCRKKMKKAFYTGQTGIIPIDDAVADVLGYAYAHHIIRLMIVGNFMLLNEIAPDDVYRWFMELFIDAYDWVMVPNVYGMSQFADGGMITSKPYISSSNYVLKMSNYESNEWSEIWDALFWTFVHKHKKKLDDIGRMGLILANLKKKSEKELVSFKKSADAFWKKMM